MRILFVADGHSPIAINWIEYFVKRGDEVHLASTFPCEPALNLASLNFIPVGFSQTRSNSSPEGGWLKRGASVRLKTVLRQWFAPLTLARATQQMQALIDHVQPDLVHAMRIPFEGMLAANSLQNNPDMPFLVSVWGNDFTLHAKATPLLRTYTYRVLARANGLHTDCKRDLHLALKWGYPERGPFLVVPGNGGIKLEIFHIPDGSLPGREQRVINPRGFRAYVRNDVFFRSIPWVLADLAETEFICPDMKGHPEALRWIAKLSLEGSVKLLPKLKQEEIAEAFRQTAVSVSPSTHDGTPNTLLEAMACGCFPVAGDLESIREWITPGVNGLLIDPNDPQDLAAGIVNALLNDELRREAAEFNRRLIQERADYQWVMKRVVEFYQGFL